VTFEELVARLSDRLESGDPALVMDESALVDLERMRLLAQPSTPGRHTLDENIRIAFTAYIAGELHLKRWQHLIGTTTDVNPAAATELFQALLAYRSLLDGPSRPPPGMPIDRMLSPFVKGLFGPEPNAEIQGNIAYFLLANAPPDVGREYHTVAADLLRVAMARIPHDHPQRPEWLRVMRLTDRQPQPRGLDWEEIGVDEVMRWLSSAEGTDPSLPPEETLVRWDEIIERLRKRLHESVLAGDSTPLDEPALADAAALVRAVRSDPERGSPEGQRRLAQACQFAGALHNFRAADRTFADGHADLARAVLFLAPLSGDGPSRLPAPVCLLIGPEAEAEAQAHYSTLLLTEAKTTPDPALIAASITLLAAAIDTLPGEATERAGYLANIAVGYGLRYERIGARGDLDRAIACAEQSLALTPSGDPNLAQRRSRIGALYQQRAWRTRSAEDNNRALQALEGAVAAAAEDDPKRAAYLMNLGAAYSARRDLPERRAARDTAADLTDLDRAIGLAERALAAGADREVAKNALFNLGSCRRKRYAISRDPADLDGAVTAHERNLASLEAGDPTRLKVLSDLPIAYEERLTATGTPVSSEILRHLTRELDSFGHGLTSHRAIGYRNVGSLAATTGDHATAADLLAKAVRLLPLLISPETDWQDREQLLGELMGLIDDAIASHCRAGDPHGAIEMSELARVILLPATENSRSDLTALESRHPDLAARLRGLRDVLNRPQDVLLGDTVHQVVGHRPYQISDRLQWQHEHDELISRIRRLPGFERFLLPADPAALRSAAAGGAVVLVNVDRRGGDAVVVTADDDPVRLPLPGLDLTAVQAHGKKLLDTTHFGTSLTGLLMRQRVLPEILQWLWAAVVEPVLAALPPRPRIWWMPSGPMTLFPLHAAGVPGRPGALDLAVSSYTSTLRALASARSREPTPVRRQLTVALEQTPNLPDLPGVTQEAEALHEAYPDAPHLRDRQATVGRVLSALSDATWVHFACHASADYLAPSRGGLRLYDGTLTIPELSFQHLRHAELAYLSACSAANRGVRLANESITLSSAFQQIGFRHVIACMWPLQDQTAATVARAFYDRMPDGPSADGAAEALRQVMIELRSAYPGRPDLWAPLTHFGP
jgi:tetratricopeptide (TPR) repeat protein